MERRTFPCSELRVGSGESGKRVIRGHAAVFNLRSGDLGGFREVIAPGAFARSIREDDIRALFNHDAGVILGRNRAGTLRLREDTRGLLTEIEPPDTQAARDVMALIERGDVSQMSFAFRTRKDEWKIEDGITVRTLRDVQVYDVSPVTFPAYPDTDVSVAGSERARAASSLAGELASRQRRLRVIELGI